MRDLTIAPRSQAAYWHANPTASRTLQAGHSTARSALRSRSAAQAHLRSRCADRRAGVQPRQTPSVRDVRRERPSQPDREGCARRPEGRTLTAGSWAPCACQVHARCAQSRGCHCRGHTRALSRAVAHPCGVGLARPPRSPGVAQTPTRALPCAEGAPVSGDPLHAAPRAAQGQCGKAEWCGRPAIEQGWRGAPSPRPRLGSPP